MLCAPHLPKWLHHEEDHGHINGGNLLQVETSSKLIERFISQQQNDQIVVHWEGQDDKENPYNWSLSKRISLCFMAALAVLNCTFASSAPSGVIPDMRAYFGFDAEVATLTISIFVAGYCVGPTIWGPLSERIGRRLIFLISMLLYTAWNVGCALSRNTASILVFRFLAGTAAAAPLSNSGGVIADIFPARTRGIAMSMYAAAPFAGPAIGPIVGGFIQVSGAGWRWLYWVCAIFSGCCFLLFLVALPETYAPVLLKRKAESLRKKTGNVKYTAPIEMVHLTKSELLRATLLKPFILLYSEPMLLAITLYMSFLYGVLYLLFEAFPIVFQGGYGFSAGIGGLMFIPFTIGAIIAVAVYITILSPRYTAKVDKANGDAIPPEARLPMVMTGAPIIVVGFFWFAWTGRPSISFWCPLISTSLLGFGFLFIFQGLFNFIIDTYMSNAASSLAANAICRSSFGAAFPLFARQMYSTLHPWWAGSLLGFLALSMVPIPFVLFFYGPKMRQMSKSAGQKK